MKIPDRKATGAAGTGSLSSALVAGPLKQFSEIWAFLTGADTVTGASRLPGSLSLKCASGLLGLTLNDAETGQYVFLQGRDLEEMLLMAEGGLGDGSLHWRPSQSGPRKRKQ